MTTGLDPAARRVAWDLTEAIRARETTVVLVTHFTDEAERLCDRLAAMDVGRIVALDTPRQLVANHTGDVEVRFTAGTGWLAGVPGVHGVQRRDGVVTIERPSLEDAYEEEDQRQRKREDPWLGLAWGWTDALVVVACAAGALILARLLFRWE